MMNQRDRGVKNTCPFDITRIPRRMKRSVRRHVLLCEFSYRVCIVSLDSSMCAIRRARRGRRRSRARFTIRVHPSLIECVSTPRRRRPRRASMRQYTPSVAFVSSSTPNRSGSNARVDVDAFGVTHPVGARFHRPSRDASSTTTSATPRRRRRQSPLAFALVTSRIPRRSRLRTIRSFDTALRSSPVRVRWSIYLELQKTRAHVSHRRSLSRDRDSTTQFSISRPQTRRERLKSASNLGETRRRRASSRRARVRDVVRTSVLYFQIRTSVLYFQIVTFQKRTPWTTTLTV